MTTNKLMVDVNKNNFPELEVSEDILGLVGILNKHSGKYDKAEYHEYLGRKYK